MNGFDLAKVIAICVCVIVMTIGGCVASTNIITNGQDDSAIVEMVRNGADPLDAYCALRSMYADVCKIRAAKK